MHICQAQPRAGSCPTKLCWGHSPSSNRHPVMTPPSKGMPTHQKSLTMPPGRAQVICRSPEDASVCMSRANSPWSGSPSPRILDADTRKGCDRLQMRLYGAMLIALAQFQHSSRQQSCGRKTSLHRYAGTCSSPGHANCPRAITRQQGADQPWTSACRGQANP